MQGGGEVKTVIAGGGVAALEAALTLKELLGERAQTTLLAPETDFVYRPLAVAEPFGLGAATRIPLAELAEEAGARVVAGRLDRVAVQHRTAIASDGAELAYDALLLTVGARPSEALGGALTYRGPRDSDAFAAILGELERGELSSLAFAVPPAVNWPLPLYELALLTAWHAERKGIEGVRLSLVTHEESPLALFGRRASDSVSRLLRRAGVEVLTSAAPAAVDGDHLLLMNGSRLSVDRVVALPRLEVAPIVGVPQGPHGFFSTDLNMRVEGFTDIYAAGDSTWFPIKQGGVATQQADTAASTIAAEADPSIPVEPFRPVLRAAIMTGTTPRYLRANVEDPDRTSASGAAPLWWPTSKVAGRRLAPFLTGRVDRPDRPSKAFGDLEPEIGEDPERAEADHVDAVELALTAADADARWDDYRGALRWLAIAEHLGFTLPPEIAAKRERWRAAEAEGDQAR
jgi:sulfide:quinone oxidoreductase